MIIIHHLLSFIRSIIVAIYKILVAGSKAFLESINCEIKRPTCAEKYRYMDAKHGKTYLEAKNRMQQNFNAKYKNRTDVTPVNLVGQDFDDGLQLFKNQVTTFEPLILTLMDLPPDMRNESGIGVILLSVITTNKTDSAEYKFIFNDCLTEELKLLEQGYEVKVNNKTYFIQV